MPPKRNSISSQYRLMSPTKRSPSTPVATTGEYDFAGVEDPFKARPKVIDDRSVRTSYVSSASSPSSRTETARQSRDGRSGGALLGNVGSPHSISISVSSSVPVSPSRGEKEVLKEMLFDELSLPFSPHPISPTRQSIMTPVLTANDALDIEKKFMRKISEGFNLLYEILIRDLILV